MSATNDFVPFCPTDTGLNLLSQSAYLVDPQLAIGNQPGVARSQLVNKALRQATYIASCVAQYISNRTGNSVLDDEVQSEVLATMALAFNAPPTVQKFLTGSGTYTTPTSPKPGYIRVRMVGGGGGGSGTGVSDGGNGGNGGNTTFGTTLLVANGGNGGVFANPGSVGGTASLGSGPIGIALQGGSGTGGGYVGMTVTAQLAGPAGAASPFGGAGGGGDNNSAGLAAVDNTGSGGGGGGDGTSNHTTGTSGASGGFVDAIIANPATTYSYAVGSAGTAGAAGASGQAGGAAGKGVIIVEEFY